MNREELKVRIRRILGSLIKLIVAMIALAALDAMFGGMKFEAFGLLLDTSEILGGIRLLAIIYYGYWILRDSLFFLDLLSDILARRFGLGEKGNLRRAGLDFLYLLSTALAWFGLSPFFRLLPDTVIRIISVLFILISLLFVYDLVKTVYSMLKISFESLVETLSELLGRELAGRSGEEEEKVNLAHDKVEEG